MTQRPSGWYVDPQDPDQLRYWDGIVWSPQQIPKIKPGLDKSELAAPHVSDPSHDGVRTGRGPAGNNNQWQAGQPAGAGSKTATTADGSRLAGWWQRAGGLVIDYLLTSMVAALVALPWTLEWARRYQNFLSDWGFSGPMPSIPQNVATLPWQIVVANIGVYGVYEIGMTAWRGQTLGKIVAGTRVRPAESAGCPSLRSAAVRFLVKCANVVLAPVAALGALAFLFGFVNYLWPLRDAGRRAIHDLAAQTCVVRTRGSQTR
ncbi:RDD family protein [Dermatophilaceae bacterium Sec6.4]